MAARIVIVGEALIDVIHRADGSTEEIPGGSPANVAITLGRMDRAPHLITALGTDRRGGVLRDWLAESQVEVTHVDLARTSTATAELDEDGAASYVFDIEWSLDGVNLPAADVIHVGSIAGLLDPGSAQLLSLLDEHRDTTLITYDPNIRPALLADRADARQRVEALVSRADVVKASDEDLSWLYPDRDPRDTARAWQKSGPAVVVMTAGAAGAFAVTASGETNAAAKAVTVVDTVGAGDTFMGALIDGLIDPGTAPGGFRADVHNLTLSRLNAVLDRAARAAAITVSRRGANPPRLHDLD